MLSLGVVEAPSDVASHREVVRVVMCDKKIIDIFLAVRSEFTGSTIPNLVEMISFQHPLQIFSHALWLFPVEAEDLTVEVIEQVGLLIVQFVESLLALKRN